jgi:hypothetical protein
MSMPWVARLPSRALLAEHGHVLCRFGWPAVEEAVEDVAEWIPSSAEEDDEAAPGQSFWAAGTAELLLMEKRRATDSTSEFREEADGRCSACTRRDLPAPEKMCKWYSIIVKQKDMQSINKLIIN